MDRNIRTLLQDKAEEMRIGATIPEKVLRRSRRRRTATAGVAALVTIGVVAGAFVGARALLRQAAEGRRVVPGGGVPEETAPEPYPFIYPTTAEELETTQQQVAEGSMPMWTDPRGVAGLFAVNVMGWDPEDVQLDVRGDQPLTAVITNPSLAEAAGAKGEVRTALELIEIPDQDPPFYVVLAAQAETMTIEPIGPDDQLGADATVALQGRLDFFPEGSSVVLTVDQGADPVATDSAAVSPDGRFEVAARPPGGIGWATRISMALVDESGATLTLTASHVAVAESEASEASAPVRVSPRVRIPAPVADTRQAILDAARARDYEALRDLIPERGFTFSYGGEQDPIAYWRNLESEGHVPVFGDVLPMVLGTEPGPVREGFIWPAQAGEDPRGWDEADLEALRQIHPQQDIRLFQKIGLYTGWRIEIARDGTWLSFVQGD